MEPYFSSFRRVQQEQQDCGIHLKLLNDETQKAKNAQNAKAGSYGVSIRVQGIDGHPYIVLNNTDTENHVMPENGQQVASQMLCKSVLDSSFAPELEEKIEDRTTLATCNTSPGVLKNLKQTSAAEGENRTSHFKAGSLQSSSLLNFQKHPELLQPYDPEKNILHLESFQSSLFSKTSPVANEKKQDIKLWSSPLRAEALDKANLQFAELTKSKAKTVNLTKPAGEEEVCRQELKCVGATNSSNGIHGSLSSSGGSTYTVSPPTYQETKKCRPDLLPFRRQDSAGSVLNDSRQSSSSSTTPTSAASLYKFFLDDQEYAIYADNVNRHENRRYIPFLPGTGRDIDTGSIPGVDQLIEKFDRKVAPQRRGRLGIRNRIHPDDRKRSRSVDSALSSGLKESSDCFNELSKSLGTSTERLQQPSSVCLQKPSSPDQIPASSGKEVVPWTVGKLQAAARESHDSHFNSLQYHKQNKLTGEGAVYKSSTLPIQNKKNEMKMVTSTLLLPNRVTTQKTSVKSFGSASSVQVIWQMCDM